VAIKKVLKFRPKEPETPVEDEFKKALQYEKEGKIRNMVLVYTVEYEPTQEDIKDMPPGGQTFHIKNYWFSIDSTLFTVGLVDYIKRKILRYLAGYGDSEQVLEDWEE